MEETIETTRTELVKAYEIWNKRFKDNPEEFVKQNEATGEGQADYLINLIKEVKES